MSRHILITNDDGIDSRFLHAIAAALGRHCRVTLAAPQFEQSWIGRAVSRRRPVAVAEHTELPWPAWTIDGTPTDCVNIALGHLLPQMPDAVVSGINIGYNTTTTLIYSSGTVAGALEGAFWGLPAFAVSQEIPDDIFAHATAGKGSLPGSWQTILEASAEHAAGLILEELDRRSDRSDPSDRSDLSGRSGSPDAVVHNLNYPAHPARPLRAVPTVPAPIREMSFFRPNGDGEYHFHFRHGENLPSGLKTDREALAAGEISHSILNFSALGRDLNH